MAERKHNFNAGPAALPLSVLQKAQAELVDFEGHGLSLLEMSHRTPTFDEVIEGAKSTLAELYDLPDTHEILFLQGGAALQFAMVPLNLGAGAYVDTGTWSSRAIGEAEIQGGATVLWSGKEGRYRHIPTDDDLGALPDGARYLHYTSNNTIYGTQFQRIPRAGAPLVADMSSDILSRPLEFEPFDLIYAGAQKNAGPSGVTIVIARRSVSRQFSGAPHTPKILRYVTQAEKDSMYNTPNTFGIWMVKMVAEWVRDAGGLPAIAERNARRAQMLYDVVDAHPLCVGHAENSARSVMNVTFRMETEALEKTFLRHTAEHGFMGLRGHRSVGGLRASIYNAVPTESIELLCDLLSRFRG